MSNDMSIFNQIQEELLKEQKTRSKYAKDIYILGMLFVAFMLLSILSFVVSESHILIAVILAVITLFAVLLMYLGGKLYNCVVREHTLLSRLETIRATYLKQSKHTRNNRDDNDRCIKFYINADGNIESNEEADKAIVNALNKLYARMYVNDVGQRQ